MSLSLSLSFSLLSLLPSSFHSHGKIVLLVLSLIGFIFFDTIYVGAVFNYAAQSEMNIYLLRAIRRLITQKEYEDMDGAIKVGVCANEIFHTYMYVMKLSSF